MTIEDFITELFCCVDDKLSQRDKNRKHSQAKLYPSEVVTIAMLFALKGVSNRAFYRWIANNFKHLFPRLPHRTRLLRLIDGHRHLIDVFMAAPSLIGVIDTYGIELIHPRREGRSKRQIGRKGISNQRWIVGGKLCLLHNHLGLIVNWDCDTANVYDGTAFQHLIDGVNDQMVVFADEGFAKAEASSNLRLCRRGEWNSRMLVETTLSMLTLDFKKVMHRRWSYFKTRVGFTMALFNLLVQWDGVSIHENGIVHLSIAQFSL